MSKKLFVLDTNVLLHDSSSIHAFGPENEVIIPITVLEELDAFKKRQDEVGRNARQVTRDLDELRAHGHLADGVPLAHGGSLRIELRHQDAASLPAGFTSSSDVKILSVAYHMTRQEARQSGGREVCLITKDINLRVKADALAVASEDYENRAIDPDELYSGQRTLLVSSDEVNAFYREKRYAGAIDPEPYPNEFFMLQDRDNPEHTAIGRYSYVEKVILGLEFPDDGDVFGIRPLNKEQRFTIELLLDDRVSLVALLGIAGTGKTLIALAAGLEKVVNHDSYRRLLVSKPIMPLGKDIGYLPGDIEEKLMPRMQSVSDNLEFLFMAGGGVESAGDRLQELIEDGIIELEALTYIRGRSIPRQYIIVDEAQNLTPQELKTIITRAGKGSKIILCGDPHQIDHPYLDSRSNGLTHVVERFKNESLFGAVTLHKGERSDLAQAAARLM